MSTSTSFGGSIPKHYEEGMGPVIFAPYARDLAARVPMKDGASILEIAGGTGRLTAELLNRLPVSAKLTATDVNPDMLAVAQGQLADQRVTWQTADACNLPFGEDQFDVVVAQFGAMFYPDRIQGHMEAKRVLKTGGTYLFNVWSPHAKNPWGAEVHATMEELVPADQPMFFAVPFSYGNPVQLTADLSLAGFRDITVEEVPLDFSSPSARQFAIGAVQGSPLSSALKERGIEDLESVVDRLEERFAAKFGSEPMLTTMSAYVACARV